MEKARKDYLLEPSEKPKCCQHLHFWLWPPELWDNKFLLLKATKFIEICHSGHRKQMQLVAALKLYNNYNTNIVESGIHTRRVWLLNKRWGCWTPTNILGAICAENYPQFLCNFKPIEPYKMGETILILQLMKLRFKKVKIFSWRPLQGSKRVGALCPSLSNFKTFALSNIPFSLFPMVLIDFRPSQNYSKLVL